MKKSNWLVKKNYPLVIGLLVISLVYVIFSSYNNPVKAQTAPADYQQDSDYDGLTDQVERDVYQTDPFKNDTDGDSYLDSAEVLLGSKPLDATDPVSSLTNQTNQDVPVAKNISIPWYTSRAAGVTSYILMFFIILLGVGMTTGFIYKYINPVKAWVIHKYLSLALGITLLTHAFSLMFDEFINFSIQDILIPLASDFKPLFLSLGIIGFYILLVIIFTSLFFRLKYKRAWRGIHYAVYALFIFSFVHGLLIGTDSKTIWMKSIYIITGAIFVSLLVYRFVFRFVRNKFSS
jgi:hypothetical protein